MIIIVRNNISQSNPVMMNDDFIPYLAFHYVSGFSIMFMSS